MNKLTRKLLVSVFTLAFALVTLGATTFAWFTLTSTAKIDNFEANLTSGEGIEISIDGRSYVSSLSLGEIALQLARLDDYANLTLSGFEFDAVTTENGHTMRTFDPDNVGQYMSVTRNTTYIEFPLWFRSPTEDATVHLLNSTAISSTAKSWAVDTTFNYTGYGSSTTVNSGTFLPVYAANALRFSFEEYGTATIPTTGTDLPTSVQQENRDLATSVYELQPLIGDTAGNTSNILLGDGSSLTNASPGMLDYFMKKSGKDLLDTYHGDAENNPLVLPTPVAKSYEFATLDQASGGYFHKMVMVRIWIEGWDPDSFDSILGAPLAVELQFGVTAPEEPITP